MGGAVPSGERLLPVVCHLETLSHRSHSGVAQLRGHGGGQLTTPHDEELRGAATGQRGIPLQWWGGGAQQGLGVVGE